MYPLRRLGTPIPPSDAEETDREERKEAVEGVETDLSRSGHAPRASEGVILGDGEEGRRYGELSLLVGGVISAMSAMLKSKTI